MPTTAHFLTVYPIPSPPPHPPRRPQRARETTYLRNLRAAYSGLAAPAAPGPARFAEVAVSLSAPEEKGTPLTPAELKKREKEVEQLQEDLNEREEKVVEKEKTIEKKMNQVKAIHDWETRLNDKEAELVKREAAIELYVGVSVCSCVAPPPSALPGISPFSLLRVRAAAYPSRAQLLVKACAPVLSQLFQWPALRQWLSGTGTGALSPVPTSPIHAGMGGRAVAPRLRGSAACSGCTCAVSGGLVAASMAARPRWRPASMAPVR